MMPLFVPSFTVSLKIAINCFDIALKISFFYSIQIQLLNSWQINLRI